MEKLPEQLSDDEIIDKTLSVYHYSRFGSHDLFSVLTNDVKLKIDFDSHKHKDIENIMIRLDLISHIENTPLRHYKITDKGIRVYSKGGWIKYKKIEENWFLRNDSKNLKFCVGTIVAIAAIVIRYRTRRL